MTWAVQFRLKRNPHIVNPRPHPWRALAIREDEVTARAYANELRQAAKECNLSWPYVYRVKQHKEASHGSI